MTDLAASGLPGLTLLRPLLRAEVAIGATDPRSVRNRAMPEEVAGLPRASTKRRRDFAAGRAAAHRAMRGLGGPARPVRIGPDRAPVWPGGLTGSISHSDTACLAAVARSDMVRAIGLDVEDDAGLEPELVATICSETERAWLSGLPPAEAGRMARLIFSAKECAYKCQYVLSRTLFGFDTLEILPDPGTGRFEAAFAAAVPPFAAGTRLTGRFAIGAGLIVTAMTLPA
ncbi:MAG: 4'-phosphopantetheinyl transferase [Jhaorihella sp.]